MSNYFCCRRRKPRAKPSQTTADLEQKPDAGSEGSSRRDFIKDIAGLAGGAAAMSVGAMSAPPSAWAGDSKDEWKDDRGRRDKRKILIKNGIIITMDPALGNFEKGDILIDGKKIIAVRPNIRASNVKEIDASGMIIIPGFSDGHRHPWLTNHRGLTAGRSTRDYTNTREPFLEHYRPEDIYYGTLLGLVGAINNGITTVVDISVNTRTAAASDAAIKAAFDSGVRVVHAACNPVGAAPWDMHLPQDLVRIKKKFFSSEDQLVTLIRGLPTTQLSDRDNLAFCRNIGLKFVLDAPRLDTFIATGRDGLLGPDMSAVHCHAFTNDALQYIRDLGMPCVIAPRSDVETGIGDGKTALQRMLNFGLSPSLSVDSEAIFGGDMFSEMHTLMAVQRTHIWQQRLAGDANYPTPWTPKPLLEAATKTGAKAAFLSHKVGTLSPGMEADIVLIKEDWKTVPTNNAYGMVTSYADSTNVDTVLIAGEVVKWRGEVVHFDLRKLRKKIIESNEYLDSKAGYTLDIFSDTFTRL